MKLCDISESGFNLANLKEGDSFMGCAQCWFQYPPKTAATNICPDCGSKMHVLDVTKEDKPALGMLTFGGVC